VIWNVVVARSPVPIWRSSGVIRRRRRYVETVDPAKAVKPAASFFEKLHNSDEFGVVVVAQPGVVFVARAERDRVALLEAGAHRHDIGSLFRTSARSTNDVAGKENFMKAVICVPCALSYRAGPRYQEAPPRPLAGGGNWKQAQ
jgi:hypothetical protein